MSSQSFYSREILCYDTYEVNSMMKMKRFYCQRDYPHILYPSPSSLHGNIANNGCGVCCACMVVEAIKGIDFPVEEGAVFSKASGAREGFGTDMSILAPALAQRFELNVVKTTDVNEVLEFLQSGRGLVIANTAGDREGWTGVFSDSRHYVVAASAQDNLIEVWDPLYCEGRYDVPGRIGKVKMDGVRAFADFQVLVNDCNGRPYYLFSMGNSNEDH